ncbi:DNA translocase FtsK 4TM domain-containing protein [Atopobium minutum]|uniref:FtsK/SpoIIIE family DNA translocase n=1 Tax=Atopobium minutum TaxID=1381 RepID=UPI002907663A|nr:DNA translocase FtsK 4TM domain-containing protein [Atopobium minutum]MDU5129492.1 DNA translocase FtsK 4TM domain-containing protein [Atopobium minutum]
MPNRSSNTSRKGKKSNARTNRGTGARRADAYLFASSTAVNDIVGVLIAVIALAFALALLSPSEAPVTHFTGQMLMQGFGAGALLVPIALFLYALTYFMSSDGPISQRIALGLTLIVVAILSILSVLVPGVEANPAIVFQEIVLPVAGGYVGGGVAWALVSLLGKLVSLVVLAGIIIAGVIVCGFSISAAVAKLQDRATEFYEAAARKREEAAKRAAQNKLTRNQDVQPQSNSKRQMAVVGEEPATTFIGARKTTVIKRGETPQEQKSSAPATTLLKHKKKTAAADKPAEGSAAMAESENTAAVAKDAPNGTMAIPSFLQKAASQDQKRKSPAAPKADPLRERTGDLDGALPPLDMIKCTEGSSTHTVSSDELAGTAAKLQSTLEEFGLVSRVVGWTSGPAVTTFKIEMGEGERVNKIRNLEDDIALSLAAKSVRIFAPIPGTSLVGIEIPNRTTQSVYLGDVLSHVTGGPLEAAFGRDSEGAPVVVDIAALPHLLVAGTTGSGKSVLLNSIVMTMLMRATPEELRLIMVDPKRVEFTFYAGLPHLYVPVVTEPRQATSALQWGVTEMERRLKVFEHYKVRDIKSFNKQVESGKLSEMDNPPQKMPYFVIVIDELSDLMMVAGKDVESSIVRIAQLGRAAGIHLIVATQRPSADVVTGLIKANIDNRVALSVDNSINSRIILDQTGAEKLLGRGDMLYKLRGRKPKRAQACFVSEAEVEQVVEFIKEHHESDYHEDILSAVTPGKPSVGGAEAASDDDPLIWEAAQIVVDSQLGSTSGIQRRLKVGYARAGRIMDMLEAKGVVGPPDGSKPREVLIDADGLEELRAAESEYREV